MTHISQELTLRLTGPLCPQPSLFDCLLRPSLLSHILRYHQARRSTLVTQFVRTKFKVEQLTITLAQPHWSAARVQRQEVAYRHRQELGLAIV